MAEDVDMEDVQASADDAHSTVTPQPRRRGRPTGSRRSSTNGSSSASSTRSTSSTRQSIRRRLSNGATAVGNGQIHQASVEPPSSIRTNARCRPQGSGNQNGRFYALGRRRNNHGVPPIDAVRLFDNGTSPSNQTTNTPTNRNSDMNNNTRNSTSSAGKHLSAAERSYFRQVFTPQPDGERMCICDRHKLPSTCEACSHNSNTPCEKHVIVKCNTCFAPFHIGCLHAFGHVPSTDIPNDVTYKCMECSTGDYARLVSVQICNVLLMVRLHVKH